MNMIAEEQKVWLLDATDRCDRCAAQAYIKVIGNAGELLFCGHHYNKVMDDPKGYESMMNFMVEVVDERTKLEE
jgi:hypothetical protein